MSTDIAEKPRTLGEKLTPRWISDIVREHRRSEWQRFIEKHPELTDVAHINDCADPGAQLRLQLRTSEILGRSAGFAAATSDLQASGLLIDALDAVDVAPDSKTKKHKDVFLVNVAPRNGEGKKHENGTPFCYFSYKGALVIATVDGLTLTLVKKLKLADSVQILDIPTVLPVLKKVRLLSDEEMGREKRIAESQFRSFDFSPYVATYLSRYGKIESVKKDISEIADAPLAAWYLDKFAEYGNVKTTILPEDVFSPKMVELLKSGGSKSKEQIGTLDTKFGSLPVYRRLKDVPDKTLAVIVGSSGLGDKRFLEIVVQGGSAAKNLGIRVGDSILDQKYD